MSENYFQPWTSDEEPKPPKGWGLATFHGNVEPFICETCDKQVQFRDQYVYNFGPSGTIILHNKKECCASIVN